MQYYCIVKENHTRSFYPYLIPIFNRQSQILWFCEPSQFVTENIVWTDQFCQTSHVWTGAMFKTQIFSVFGYSKSWVFSSLFLHCQTFDVVIWKAICGGCCQAYATCVWEFDVDGCYTILLLPHSPLILSMNDWNWGTSSRTEELLRLTLIRRVASGIMMCLCTSYVCSSYCLCIEAAKPDVRTREGYISGLCLGLSLVLASTQ